MLEEQKDQIRWLRSKGWGYKRIASSVGLTRDQVRYYCIKVGITGYGTELIKDENKSSNQNILHKFCLQCGKKLNHEGRGRKRKYCNYECKKEWDKKNKKRYSYVCQYCGKEYTSIASKGSKFCSMEYSTRDRFYRKEDAREFVDKILANEKVGHIPKWLKDLILSTE